MDTQENTTPEQTQSRVINSRKGRKQVDKKAESLEKLKVEYLAVDKIKPNGYNPNRQSDHDFELLLRSIEEDGFTQPVIITNDDIIVDGEHRWRAGCSLGMKHIPVVRVNMSAEQARISTIRHNRARGSHDIELEAEVLRDLQKLGALDWAQDSLMLDDLEIQRLIEDVSAPEALAGEDFTEAWEPQKDNRESVTGDADQSMTNKALERVREQEKKMEQAKTEEEKQTIRRESNIYRINLLFSDEEADVIRSVLGETPAQKLLEICMDLSKKN